MKKSPNYNGPMRFAHRGLVQYGPENTIEAFAAAIDYGCEGIELDVELSADGEVIVMHDDDFSRMTSGVVTTDMHKMNSNDILNVTLPFAGHLLPYEPPVPYSEGEGSCRTYTKEQIAEFEKNDKRTTKLVTFKQFDEWFATRSEDVTIEIEIKDLGIAPRLAEILKNSKNVSRYILFSGVRAVNKEIQATFGFDKKPEGLRLGANIRWLTPENLEFVKECDFWEIGLNDNHITKEEVDMLADMGIKVFSNLGDYPEWWQAINELNITGFKTNYAEAYTDWKQNN